MNANTVVNAIANRQYNAAEEAIAEMLQAKVSDALVSKKEEVSQDFGSQLGEAKHDKDYDEFFDKAMKKFGISSPADLKTDEKKKEFFDYVDKNFKAKNEEVELDEETAAMGSAKMSKSSVATSTPSGSLSKSPVATSTSSKGLPKSTIDALKGVSLPPDFPSSFPDLLDKEIRRLTGQSPKKIIKRAIRGKGLPPELRPKLTPDDKKALMKALKAAYPGLPGFLYGILMKFATGQPLTFLEKQILKLLGIDLNQMAKNFELPSDFPDDVPDLP